METREINFKCPSCGADCTMEYMDIVNVTLDPELAEDVLKGKINTFTCSECGCESRLDMPFIYCDLQARLMIMYAPEGEEETTELVRDAELESLRDFTLRIVHSYERLIEKLMTAAFDLDDRAVEVMKLYLLERLKEDEPDLDVRKVLLDVREEKPYMVFVDADGDCFAMPFDEELYDEVYNTFYDAFEEYSTGGFEEVDDSFARGIIDEV